MIEKLYNISKMDVERRTILKITGAGILLTAFLPRVAFAARNSIQSMRTGVQPGGKTRLVIETASRPSYSLSYSTDPNQLIVTLSNTSANASAKPALASGTLVKTLTQDQVGDKLKVTASLTRSIGEIPKSQIMILEPNGDTDYRLVLDFTAGGGAKTTAAATATATKSTGTSPAKSTRKPIVVIDAGHGGKDPGCIGKAGVREKNIVLNLAKKLRTRLVSAGYIVYMTRETDIFLNLDTRAGIAEKRKADLFISLHANANPKADMKGFSIYTLSKKASDEEAAKLAEAENAADKIEVDGFEKFEPDIRNALSALQQHGVATASVEFAACVQKAFRSAGVREQPNGSLRSAPFGVLRSTIPGALIEIGHLSNRDEEKLLNSDGHQNQLAAAITTAIGKYDFDI